MHAAPAPIERRSLFRVERDFRELPISQRVGTTSFSGRRAIAGCRVDLRRRVDPRVGIDARVLGPGTRPKGRHLRCRELPPRGLRVPCFACTDRGICAPRQRRLGISRSDRRAEVGAEKHCRLRRQSRQRHADRPIGRVDGYQRSAGESARAWPVRAGRRHEWGHSRTPCALCRRTE